MYSCAGERGRSEKGAEEWAEVDALLAQARTMVMAEPGLWPWAMTWSVTLMQLWGSVLMSVAPVTIEDPVDAGVGPLPMTKLMFNGCAVIMGWGKPCWSRIPVLLPRTMVMSSLDCCWGSCVGLWPCCCCALS